MLPQYIQRLGFFFFTLIVSVSCSTKQSEQNVQLASNRNMAIVLRKISATTPETKIYFEALLSKALQETYQPQIKTVDIDPNSLIENPDNLFKIANQEVDDLFLLEVQLPNEDSLPPQRPEDKALAEQMAASFLSQSVEVSGRIINGANLRTVSLVKANIPWNFRDEFEEDFLQRLKSSLMNIFANPNVYPKSNPMHFANLLYVYSQNQERQAPESLNCVNAREILSHYDKAYQLYQKANSRHLQNTAVGSQEEVHELNARLEQASKKSEILRKCDEDLKKGFEFQVNYGSLDPSYIPFIQKTFEKAKLEDLLKKYTNKPVLFEFNPDPSGSMGLNVILRFDPERYRAWTKDRIPSVVGDYHIVSLDPYYALMQTLIYIKDTLPSDAPRPLISSFRSLEINLTLDTLLSGQLSFRVAGNYSPEDKKINIAYPKSVYLVAPGYQSKTLFTRSEEIFQEKGWLAFSSCKTLDGTLTEDGLLMRFLGLECKV